MEKEHTLTLVISGLTVDDAKELAKRVFEMAEKDPTRNYQCIIQGLEGKTLEEARRILQEVFPLGGIAR
jgi:vacuolar-type H+-ATPase subunit H